MTIYAKSLTQAIQRLNSNPYNLTKDECIQVVRELRAELEALPTEPKDQTQWDRVCALIRHWSQRAQAAEGALQRLVALHDEPFSLAGKFGKKMDEAVEKRAAAVEGAIANARDVLAKIP
jgi:hypothetical protein